MELVASLIDIVLRLDVHLAVLVERYGIWESWSVVTALLAVTQWDSLVVDVRDAAILEPLPVRPTSSRSSRRGACAFSSRDVRGRRPATRAVPRLYERYILFNPFPDLARASVRFVSRRKPRNR